MSSIYEILIIKNCHGQKNSKRETYTSDNLYIEKSNCNLNKTTEKKKINLKSINQFSIIYPIFILSLFIVDVFLCARIYQTTTNKTKQTLISTQEVCSNQPQSMIYSQEFYNFLYFF